MATAKNLAAPPKRARYRRALSALLALPAALLLVFTTATSASAHVVYQSDEVWANADSTKCQYTYAEISHGAKLNGYVKAYGLSSSAFDWSSCILVWNRPAGHLAVGYRYLKWDGAEWYVCRELMHGFYNQSETSRVTLTYDFGDYPPCEVGTYSTTAYSAVLYGGLWNGRDVPVNSGSHFLPD